MPHRLLFVHPHPDDESIACGGVIAAGVRAGDDVHVVTCTGGEEGENQSGIDLGDRPMDVVRREEMAAAVEALGAPTHHWLGYRDSGMAGEPSNEHPDAFHGAPVDEAAGRLAALVRELRPHVVVSDDEHGTYGHPDHVKAHVVTTRAVELAGDPGWDGPGEPWSVPKRYVHVYSRARLWLFHTTLLGMGLASPFGEEGVAGPDELAFGLPDELVTTQVDVTAVLDRKRAAMAAHASQIGDESFFLNTPVELAEQAFGLEEFQLLAGDAAPVDGVERELTAGVGTVS